MPCPNILILISHDTGKHIAPYGASTVHTPALDRIAGAGVVLRQHFCTAPQCSPSRASIVTGRMPHSTGVMGLTHADFRWRMHPGEQHLSRLLGAAGYECTRFGLAHETSPASVDELLAFERTYPSGRIADQAEAVGTFLAERDAGRPFYAQLQCNETHRDFLAGGVEPDDSLGVALPSKIPEHPASIADYAAFQGSIRSFDAGVGALLGQLEAAGVADDTIVIVTTDHGAAMPFAKGSLYDAGIDAFCILRYPAWGAGRRCEALTSHLDLVPTLLAAAGADVPDGLHGCNLLPWLEGTGEIATDAIFAEKTFHDCYDPMRCVRTARWKYIRYFDKSTLHRFTGDAILAGGAFEAVPRSAMARKGLDELYDLAADPGEERNLVDDAAHQDVRIELAAKLLAMMEATGDPILDGPIASPTWGDSVEGLRATAAVRAG